MKSTVIEQQVRNYLKSLKRTATTLKKKWKYSKNVDPDVYWISLGENCLPDDILRRHNRKSFSSIFSSGRSNIEYILQMERDNYRNLLNKTCLQLFPDGEHSVVRSTFYKNCINQYSERHMLGFEFTHHDPLNIIADNQTFKRRIARQLNWRGHKNFVFLYHHRITANSNLTLLRAHLTELLALYNTKGCECEMVLFYQHIVPKETVAHIDFTPHAGGVLEFVCHTHDIWGGDDQDTFWARNDDSLFTAMFDAIDKYHQSKGPSRLDPTPVSANTGMPV